MDGCPQAEPVVAVGAVIVGADGRIVLVRRARAPGAGTWTLPGGRVEAGETMEQAVVREVHEETGLATRVVCGLGIVTVSREGYAYVIHEHLVMPLDVDAAITAGDDAETARWAAREDLTRLGVRADAVAVIDRGLAEARRRLATSNGEY